VLHPSGGAGNCTLKRCSGARGSRLRSDAVEWLGRGLKCRSLHCAAEAAAPVGMTKESKSLNGAAACRLLAMRAATPSFCFKLCLLIPMLGWLHAAAQTETPDSDVTTIRVSTSLVLADVIAETTDPKLHSKNLVPTLERGDFKVFDNGHEVHIQSFDAGAQLNTRPIALWLIVQCNLGFPAEAASGFMKGKTKYLAPAFARLDKDDVVGVAHWCDNGEANLDLVPGRDAGAALAKVEEILNGKRVNGDNRSGELALQRMIRMILENVHGTTPLRLPIYLFLYGDASGTRTHEAESVLQDLLESSGIVFGINDGFPYDPATVFRGDQIHFLIHYYGQATGGQVYATHDPTLFANALDFILLQLHFRYTVGFKPPALDGKRHALKVELTEDAKKKYPATDLRFRPEYVPLPGVAPK